MAIDGNVAIRVSTDVMISQAEEVRRLGKDMRNRLEHILELAERTKAYWNGEAGDLHRQLYESQRSDMDLMMRRLLEHPDDLLAIAQNYVDSEKRNIETSQLLQSDIIS